MTANQGTAFGAGQGYISQFGNNLKKLESGQDVAPNPWQKPAYLSNVNRLQSGALNANKNATDQQLAAVNRRTGGMNNASAYGAIRDTGLQTGRLADQLSAERAAGDYNKNVAYQTGMAEMPLAGAQAESPYYSTSVGGTDASNQALTQLGIAAYGPWNSLIQGVTSGAASAGRGS
jgi:hypothetical protein